MSWLQLPPEVSVVMGGNSGCAEPVTLIAVNGRIR